MRTAIIVEIEEKKTSATVFPVDEARKLYKSMVLTETGKTKHTLKEIQLWHSDSGCVKKNNFEKSVLTPDNDRTFDKGVDTLVKRAKEAENPKTVAQALGNKPSEKQQEVKAQVVQHEPSEVGTEQDEDPLAQ